MLDETHDLAASLDTLGAEIARAQPPLDPVLRDRLIFAAGVSAGCAKRRLSYGWAGATLGLVCLSLVSGAWWGLRAGGVNGSQVVENPDRSTELLGSRAPVRDAKIISPPGVESPTARDGTCETPRTISTLCSLDQMDAWLRDGGDSRGQRKGADREVDAHAEQQVLTPIRVRKLLSSL